MYLPPRPLSRYHRPDLVGLPRLTPWRRAFRCVIRLVCKGLRWSLARTHIQGVEHLPRKGPAILVTNHLGDADVVLILSVLPVCPEALASIDLLEYRWVFWLLHAYGVIWVHRGRADRAALQAALKALREGRVLAVAPEGRQSLIGGLMPGTEGAAYLALKSGAPVVPMGITGTFNWQVFPRLKRFQRLDFGIRIGPPFRLRPQARDRREALQEATETIMRAIARLLPPEYRGVYADDDFFYMSER